MFEEAEECVEREREQGCGDGAGEHKAIVDRGDAAEDELTEAMVATPTEVTVAVRRPARMMLAESGSSTFTRRCMLLIPSALLTSMRAGSMLRMPV